MVGNNSGNKKVGITAAIIGTNKYNNGDKKNRLQEQQKPFVLVRFFSGSSLECGKECNQTDFCASCNTYSWILQKFIRNQAGKADIKMILFSILLNFLCVFRWIVLSPGCWSKIPQGVCHPQCWHRPCSQCPAPGRPPPSLGSIIRLYRAPRYTAPDSPEYIMRLIWGHKQAWLALVSSSNDFQMTF